MVVCTGEKVGYCTGVSREAGIRAENATRAFHFLITNRVFCHRCERAFSREGLVYYCTDSVHAIEYVIIM